MAFKTSEAHEYLEVVGIKKNWHGIGVSMYAFIVLEDRCESPRSWPLYWIFQDRLIESALNSLRQRVLNRWSKLSEQKLRYFSRVKI